MNDDFHEQLITKKQKGNPLVIRIIVVVFIILFLTIGALFLGFLSIIIAVVLGVTAYFYIFPNLSVDCHRRHRRSREPARGAVSRYRSADGLRLRQLSRSEC